MSLFGHTFRQDAAGTTLSCTGLDGDRYGLLVIRFYLWFASGGTAPSIHLNPNGSSSNLDDELSADFGTPSAQTNWRIGTVVSLAANDAVFYGSVELFTARTLDGNTVRIAYKARATASNVAGGDHAFRNTGGILTSTASNLTSIDFVSNAADIEVGSYARVDQLIPDNALL